MTRKHLAYEQVAIFKSLTMEFFTKESEEVREIELGGALRQQSLNGLGVGVATCTNT